MWLSAMLVGWVLVGQASSVTASREGPLGVVASRSLLQEQTKQTSIFMVDFDSVLPETLNAAYGKSTGTGPPFDIAVEEFQVKGQVNVSVPEKEGLIGSYALSSSELKQLVDVVQSEVPTVPAAEATVTTVAPDGIGVGLKGNSVLAAGAGSKRQPLRVATIFDPFRAGHRFVLSSTNATQPPIIMHMTNFTLLVANSSYGQLQTSGIMDFFELGDRARICISDSEFMLQSCDGFSGDFNMWCCTRRQCNIEYTRQAVEDLGFDLSTQATQFLRCTPLVPPPTEQPLPIDGSSGGGDDDSVTVPLVATTLSVAVLLCCTLGVLWRHRRHQRMVKLKEEEMQAQIGNYEEQLQAHQERSKTEQAELQKIRMQYKMLEMDLLANTGNSEATIAPPPLSSRMEKNKNTTLTVIDADSEQSAQSIQRQLRSVLHAADERTPVSVQAEIGRGAFGVVYRGVWKNIQVAIKTVLFQATGDIQNDPVLREAMLALRIAHPNLVATYRANVRMLEDAGLPSGVPNIHFTGDITPSYQLFLLQEYCDSGTLYDWLSRERMHPGNVPDKAVIVRCALDIARGVQHLHHSEIVHGDLKPQNIMLTTVSEAMRRDSRTASPPSFPYQAKLTDFGLSFQMDRNKSHLSNMRIGTPFYFAPEVQGKGYLSKAADMYSFGVLMWEMFHGMPPYAAEEGHLVANASFPRFDLRHRDDAPFSYVVVALACLSNDHERRPSIDDVVMVLEDLNECLNGVADGSMLMRNASIKRVTKGSFKAGFTAPASLQRQADAAPPRIPAVPLGEPTRASKGALAVGALEKGAAVGAERGSGASVSETILHIIQRSGLHRDADLRKRLNVTGESELARLVGASANCAKAQHRVLKDASGVHGVASVHINQQWMFDVLPPTSLAGGDSGEARGALAPPAPVGNGLR